MRKANVGPPVHIMASPVPHLLSTNEAPIVNEELVIHSYINKLSAKALNIQRSSCEKSHNANPPSSRIIRVPGSRITLADLRKSIYTHRRALSISRRIPTELLVIIFTLVTTQDDDEMAKPPWMIAHTCRRWRMIALATPALWRFIEVRVVEGMHHSLKNVMALTHKLLKLSGAKPLQITFHWNSIRFNPLPIFNLLISHYKRWEVLSLTSRRSPPSLITNLTDIHHNMPLLKSVSLDFSSRHNSLLYMACKLLEVSTCLEIVSLNGVSPPHFNLDWGRLKRFQSSSCHPTIISTLINRSSKLERLEYHHSDTIHPSHLHVQILPALTHLIITYNSMDSSRLLLRHLSLPQLELLDIHHPRDAHGIFSSILLMLENSGRTFRRSALGSNNVTKAKTSLVTYHPLRSLSFESSRPTDACINSLAHLVPDLQELSMPFPEDNLFMAFTTNGGIKQTPFPNLKSINIPLGSNPVSALGDTFRTFIAERSGFNNDQSQSVIIGEQADSTAALDTPVTPCCLESVKIIFGKKKDCHNAIEILERVLNATRYSELWPEKSDDQNHEQPGSCHPGIEEMRSWTLRIANCARTIKTEHRQLKEGKLDLTWTSLSPDRWKMQKCERVQKKFEKWFAELESYGQNIQDVRYFYVSGRCTVTPTCALFKFIIFSVSLFQCTVQCVISPDCRCPEEWTAWHIATPTLGSKSSNLSLERSPWWTNGRLCSWMTSRIGG